MIKAAQRLEDILSTVPSRLQSITEKDAAEKASPAKWSRKEELGHLIDSAANNHQRFVRMQIENNLLLPQYRQDEWVSVQHYQERAWDDIVSLWKIYNLHLLHVLKHMDESRLANTATFPQYGTQALRFIADDYVDHMHHHLDKILNKNL